jgi:hypothetical protein
LAIKKNNESVGVVKAAIEEMFGNVETYVNDAFLCKKCKQGDAVKFLGFMCGYSYAYFQVKCKMCGHEWKEMYGYNGKGLAKYPWEE